MLKKKKIRRKQILSKLREEKMIKAPRDNEVIIKQSFIGHLPKEEILPEKKEANYRQQLKSSPAQPKPKRKKKVVAPKVAVTTSAPILGQTRDKAPAQKPKQNKLRKFWGWLNGEYDKY